MRVSHRHFLFGSIAVVLLLVGCGSNTGAGGSTPPPTGVPTRPPTRPVVLEVGAASYSPGSVVSILIKNQGQQPIFFADHRTNCTVLLVERLVGSSWQALAPCRLMIATRVHSLQAGATLEVKLSTSNQWPAGRYHARLDYGIGSQTGLSTPTAVYSSEFLLA